MSGQPEGEDPARSTAPDEAWERARRRAEVFGEPLPETTSDDREAPPAAPRDGDTWLKEQVPPHHGD